MKGKRRNAQKRARSVLEFLDSFRYLITCALAAMSIGVTSAREPTAADTEFCNRYAEVVQTALEVDRSGDPAAINKFRQSVSEDPQAQLLVRGLGVSLTTPPWVADVTVQSRQQCLDEVMLDRRGYLPGDAERPKPENTAGSYVIRLPSEHNPSVPTSPGAPPAGPSEGVAAASDATLMKQWSVLQDACRGGPDGSACERRDRVTDALIARGFEQHNHDVWTSQADAGHFYGVVESTHEWAATQSTTMHMVAGPALLRSLRTHLSDEKIVAIWNKSHGSIRDKYPRAWPILDRQIKQVVADHIGDTDPRFTLEY